MSKQFKRYRAYTTNTTTGELSVQRNGDAPLFTYPADFSDKQVRKAVAAKLERIEDAVFIELADVIELA